MNHAYRVFFAIFGVACCVLVGLLILTPGAPKQPVKTAAAPAPVAPATPTAPVAQTPQPSISVYLKKNGTVTLDQVSMTLVQLQQKLSSLHDAHPLRAVVLRYENGASFQSIRGVLDACHAAQLTHIAFVDTRPDKGSGRE